MLAIGLNHTDGTPGGDLLEATCKAALERHMLTLSCGVHANGMPMDTPLNVTQDIIDEGIAILDESLNVAQLQD